MTSQTTHPIKVVVRRTGLSPHLIRIWERRYRAVAPTRTDTNRRLYTDQDVERLLLLHRAVRAGRSIGSVAHLSSSELQRLVTEDETKGHAGRPVTRKIAAENSPQHFMELAFEAVKDFEAERLDSYLRQASVVLSQPVLIEQLVVPLMYRLGDLWHEGEVRVAHEHLASSVVRSFLGNLQMAYVVAPNAPVILLTTPTGHLHEFGALLAAATAASEGWDALYLGRNLPVEEIALVARRRRARAVGLSLVYPPDDSHLPDELVNLRKLMPAETAMAVGGRCASNYQASIDKVGAKLVKDLPSFRVYLDLLRRNLPKVKSLEI